MKKTNKSSTLISVFEWIETFLVALCCVVIIFTFLVKFVTVSGDSMDSTLADGNRLLITNMFYEPECGDIIVVDVSGNLNIPRDHGVSSSAPYIKRVIATEGQAVEVRSDWSVWVDGKKIDEPYIHRTGTFMYTGEMTHCVVPKDHVFVMGDNRNNSTDSRDIGPIHKNYILGHVILRLAPSFGGVE